MEAILISADSIYDDKGYIDQEIFDTIEEYSEKFIFVFMANNREKARNAALLFGENENIVFNTRANLRSIINKNPETRSLGVVLGNKDHDMYLASNVKMIFTKPGWKDVQNEAEKYGIRLTKKGFKLLLEILLNNKTWFYHLDIDSKTTLMSILDPRTYYAQSKDEEELINRFSAVLKDGQSEYRNLAIVLFTIMVCRKEELKDVNIWGCYPSSKGEASPIMNLIKEVIRKTMNKRMSDDILIRHTPVDKSHEMGRSNRISCDRHFDSLYLNPKYRKKLKGKVVCILDDYATNGTSSEVVRNLLLNEGVKKVYIVTLGKFNSRKRPDYIVQEYEMNGDLFTSQYDYELVEKYSKEGSENPSSHEEIHNLMQLL